MYPTQQGVRNEASVIESKDKHNPHAVRASFSLFFLPFFDPESIDPLLSVLFTLSVSRSLRCRAGLTDQDEAKSPRRLPLCPLEILTPQ